MIVNKDDDKCETCPAILEELETIDDDTDKHGIQFVKSKDSKLASEIGIFSFPALVYYETGVPIMYNGMEFRDSFNCISKIRDVNLIVKSSIFENFNYLIK